jgi:hypothetical protein
MDIQTIKLNDYRIQEIEDGMRLNVLVPRHCEIRSGLLLFAGDCAPEDTLYHNQYLVEVAAVKHTQVKFLSVRDAQEHGVDSVEDLVTVEQIDNPEFSVDSPVTILKVLSVEQKMV